MSALFLDDERIPSDVYWIALPERDWSIVRNMEQFVAYLELFGTPDIISFDNDLGDGEPEGRECLNWFVEQVLDGKLKIPENFRFFIHSKNNIAAEAMRGKFENLLRHIGREDVLQ